MNQKSPNEYGQVVDKTTFANSYNPEVREAVARQQAQEEAFAVPSVRGINGRGMHAQMRTLPDTGAGAGGVAYEAGVTGMADDDAVRESSEIFSNSNGVWGTGKSEIGGDAIVFSQMRNRKSPNDYGQVVDKTTFANSYNPEVREAVARQQAQEEAFAVPSVRGINGRGMHAQMRTLPDTGAGAGGVAYESGVTGMADDDAVRESSEIFSSSNGAWGTGKSEIGGDAIVFSQMRQRKSPNEYGQVVDKTTFANSYNPEVREAVARQQAQEEAFAVPSVRGINGRGMH